MFQTRTARIKGHMINVRLCAKVHGLNFRWHYEFEIPDDAFYFSEGIGYSTPDEAYKNAKAVGSPENL